MSYVTFQENGTPIQSRQILYFYKDQHLASGLTIHVVQVDSRHMLCDLVVECVVHCVTGSQETECCVTWWQNVWYIA